MSAAVSPANRRRARTRIALTAVLLLVFLFFAVVPLFTRIELPFGDRAYTSFAFRPGRDTRVYGHVIGLEFGPSVRTPAIPWIQTSNFDNARFIQVRVGSYVYLYAWHPTNMRVMTEG